MVLNKTMNALKKINWASFHVKLTMNLCQTLSTWPGWQLQQLNAWLTKPQQSCHESLPDMVSFPRWAGRSDGTWVGGAQYSFTYSTALKRLINITVIITSYSLLQKPKCPSKSAR